MLSTIGLLCLLAGQTPEADERALSVEITPLGDPQIAIWIEDDAGNFVDTVMVTRLIGTFGLGNRPGRPDFGGGHYFPYGRREHALPIWAHRRNVKYERIVFQDCRESALGWHESHSSLEPFYCRPTTELENSVDAITCPTSRFSSDKGMPFRLTDPNSRPECAALGALEYSFYPPRNDLVTHDPRDWDGVAMLREMNDLDAVSRATPRAAERYRATYRLPAEMPAGDYTVFVEVNQEFDTNEFHDYTYFVDPALRDYGIPERGQPSVLWEVPITVGENEASNRTLDYVGYGAPDGQDGQIRPPDETITTGVPGSGAERLQAMSGEEGEYRVLVAYSPDAPCAEPPPVAALTQTSADHNTVMLSFDPPTETNNVSLYEVHYRLGEVSMETEEDFMNALPGPEIAVADGGPNEFAIDLLQPSTPYTVAIRTVNFCGQASAAVSIPVRTTERRYETVDACFIATAAYGSIYQEDVVVLRGFRDQHLAGSSLGEGVIDLYYEVSPPIADLIRDSDTLRAVTRFALRPLVWLARAMD